MRFSCAGHVMDAGWKGFPAIANNPQTVAQIAVRANLARSFSCAGHVMDLLLWKSTAWIGRRH
jgi:hypothetical protein